MAEWVYVGQQTVQPGEFILFNEVNQPCNLGLILHLAGSGGFTLKGRAIKPQALCRRCPCLGGNDTVNYKVKFGANVAVPTGETVGPITVAIVVGSTTLLGTEMESTPTAVEEFQQHLPRYACACFQRMLSGDWCSQHEPYSHPC